MADFTYLEEAQLSKPPPESSPKDTDDRAASIDRRGFLTSGAAAGAVAMAAAPAQSAQAQEPLRWDREVDVVVIGAGAGGLTAAIAAREKGASVVIVEKNFRHWRARHDEFRRPLYRRRQPHAEGDRRNRLARPDFRGLVATGKADGPIQRPGAGAHPCRQ